MKKAEGLKRDKIINVVAMCIGVAGFVITGLIGSWFIACINIPPFLFNLFLFLRNTDVLPTSDFYNPLTNEWEYSYHQRLKMKKILKHTTYGK